ncbi:hypothetical protein ACJMK2_033315 [Sinanodonta woodiana]|uniref:Ubiquitin-like domain-containing protein n=2 Tax=Sinanodonta woodiana TaxID=1069815 RepID=A0ABD3WN05_SINWO
MSTFNMASQAVAMMESSNTSGDTCLTNEKVENVDTQETSDPGGDESRSQQQSDPDQNTSNDTHNTTQPDQATVDFKIIFNKQKYDVIFPLDNTVAKLKEHVQDLTGVPPAMQKIMFKGLAKDEITLRDLKVTKGAKVMVVGSTLTDVLAVSAPSPKEQEEITKSSETSKEPLCQQKNHKKVLDKYGKPDDLMPGIKNKKEPLPPTPVSGMYNKSGGKVRLTFKLELDQVWIGTKERTDKMPMNSVKAIVSEPIEGSEEYHIMGLQLGPTEASRYWIYWVPAQYVDAIKDTILGKWQYF